METETPVPPAEAQHEDGGGQSQKQSYVRACVQAPHTHTQPAEVTTWSLKPS